MSRMVPKLEWTHLSTPGMVRGRSKILADAVREFLGELVDVRRGRGMSQTNVAEVLGVSPQAISKLERYDADPKLSTLQRYANAVGAIVEITVRPDRGESLQRSHDVQAWSVSLTGSPVRFRGDSREARTAASRWLTSEVVAEMPIHKEFEVV